MVDVPKGGVQEFTILACNWVGAVLFITRCERFKCQKGGPFFGGGCSPPLGAKFHSLRLWMAIRGSMCG